MLILPVFVKNIQQPGIPHPPTPPPPPCWLANVLQFGDATFKYASLAGIYQGIKECLKSSLRKWSIRGSYQTIWSLTNVTWHSGAWSYAVTPSIDKIRKYMSSWLSGPHQQRTRHLVLCNFGTCICTYIETNLSQTCRFSGLLSLEYPLVLLFYFIAIQEIPVLTKSQEKVLSFWQRFSLKLVQNISPGEDPRPLPC